MWPYQWDHDFKYHCLRKNKPVEYNPVMPVSVASDKEKGNIIFAKQTVKASHLCSEKRTNTLFTVSHRWWSLSAPSRLVNTAAPGLPWTHHAHSYMKQWIIAWLLQVLLQNAPLSTALRHPAIHLCCPLGCDAWNRADCFRAGLDTLMVFSDTTSGSLQALTKWFPFFFS